MSVYTKVCAFTAHMRYERNMHYGPARQGSTAVIHMNTFLHQNTQLYNVYSCKHAQMWWYNEYTSTNHDKLTLTPWFIFRKVKFDICYMYWKHLFVLGEIIQLRLQIRMDVPDSTIFLTRISAIINILVETKVLNDVLASVPQYNNENHKMKNLPKYNLDMFWITICIFNLHAFLIISCQRHFQKIIL